MYLLGVLIDLHLFLSGFFAENSRYIRAVTVELAADIDQNDIIRFYDPFVRLVVDVGSLGAGGNYVLEGVRDSVFSEKNVYLIRNFHLCFSREFP